VCIVVYVAVLSCDDWLTILTNVLVRRSVGDGMLIKWTGDWLLTVLWVMGIFLWKVPLKRYVNIAEVVGVGNEQSDRQRKMESKFYIISSCNISPPHPCVLWCTSSSYHQKHYKHCGMDILWKARENLMTGWVTNNNIRWVMMRVEHYLEPLVL